MSGFQQSDKPYTPDDTLTTKSPGKTFAKPLEQICHQKDQEPEIRINTGFSGSFHWLGMRDSNSHIQRLVFDYGIYGYVLCLGLIY